jgi:hypothetical protein
MAAALQFRMGVMRQARERRSAMETLMAAAAVVEIFLASLGLATMFAALALRGAFWLMRGTSHQMKFARGASSDSVMNAGLRAGLVPVRISTAARAR